MENKTILLSAPYLLPYKDRFLPIFKHYGCEVIVADVNERLSEKEILRYAGKFDGTVCGDDRYTPDIIKLCAPRLKVISKWGTGIDSIDKTAAEKFGIQVFRSINAFTVPVSDSVMGYILAFARLQPWLDEKMKSGAWEKLPGRALSECTLGVIGVGYIGKEVLRKAHAFSMKLLATDIVAPPQDFVDRYGVQMVSLYELLQTADFISVNCDLNPTSYHLLNDQAFVKVKPGAVVINTARGPIIEEPALNCALQEKRLGGAALDVFEVEPLPLDSPLLKMKNVMLAPHNSNSSPLAWEKVHWNTILNLLDGLRIPHPDFDDLQNKYMQV
ncbi:MAG: phosphoglycerate dehydrogenase [Pelolinea sp.]|nr:phosphoglycerate dehydrogenase [Pelolinea sp.]